MWWGSAGALHVHDADTCSTRDVISLHWCSYCTWEQLLNEVHDVRLDIRGHVSTQDSEDISAMVSDWKVFFLCVSKGSLLTDLSLISPLQCFKSTRNYLPRMALGQELWISSKPCLFSQHFPVLILSSSLEPKICACQGPQAALLSQDPCKTYSGRESSSSGLRKNRALRALICPS